PAEPMAPQPAAPPAPAPAAPPAAPPAPAPAAPPAEKPAQPLALPGAPAPAAETPVPAAAEKPAEKPADQPAEKTEKKAEEKPDAKKPATGSDDPFSTNANGLKTWTDATGLYQIEARFVGVVEGDVVRLQRPDGRYVRVAMDRLSALDQQWVRDAGHALAMK
ncbi:MAG: SHD1 domain-containing protein, partial [Planctomycetia bacterium]|nr:SHD1 domain-containing protein [Planctomycetia bacterium]